MWLVDTLKTCWQEISGWFVVLLKWMRDHWELVGIISVSSLLLSIVGCAALITYLPFDYFTDRNQPKHIKNPFLRFFVLLLKNIVGVILIVVGVLTSVPGIPGQGLLTILAGIILSDFPGKKRLAHRIIRIRVVFLAANKIRMRFKRQPLVLNEEKQ